MTEVRRNRVSEKARSFTESVIREMTRVASEHGSINLAQGFPDFPAPLQMKQAACEAISGDINQYSITWGAESLREAIALRTSTYNRIPTDAFENVTVCCGATECMITALMAVVDPGDEVVIFEPFYENYGPDCILSGATPRFVKLRPPEFGFDPEELRAAFNANTRALILNTPHNPTGKVFSREELELIAELAREFDAYVITDEIYEYILYDGHEHISIAALEDMADRTITISGLSKTWSATGWRIGWCVAPADVTGAIRKVHDFLTVGAPAPLQEAAAMALAFDDEYFRSLARDYESRRNLLVSALIDCGFEAYEPSGAYYVMAGIRSLTDLSDVEFAMQLARNGGVASVPGSSFCADPADGRDLIRFCFAKKQETLEAAARILRERQGNRS